MQLLRHSGRSSIWRSEDTLKPTAECIVKFGTYTCTRVSFPNLQNLDRHDSRRADSCANKARTGGVDVLQSAWLSSGCGERLLDCKAVLKLIESRNMGSLGIIFCA